MSETEIPIIDVQPLLKGGEAERRAVVEKIGEACRGIGFFCVVNHGVPRQLREDVFATAERFFNMAPGEKEKVNYSAKSGNRGYIPMKGEWLDPTSAPDLKEAYNIGLDLTPDDPEIINGARFRALNLWPSVPGFRDTMMAYFDAVWSVGRTLHHAFAADLGIDEKFFDDKLDRPLATLRLLHYPARPAAMAEGQYAPANIPTMAVLPCWRLTMPVGCKYAPAAATGCRRPMFPTPLSAISATA